MVDIRVSLNRATYEDSEIKDYVKLLFEFDNYGHEVNVKNINIIPINPKFRVIPFNFVKSIISGKSYFPIRLKLSEINLCKIHFEFILENDVIKSNEINIG